MSIFYQTRREPYRCFVSHNNSYPAHIHKEIEFTYVLSGSISIAIDDEIRTLKKGDCALAFPNSIHRSETLEQSDILLCIFNLDFMDDFTKEFTDFRPETALLSSSLLSKDSKAALQHLSDLSHAPLKDPRLAKAYLTIALIDILEKMHLKPFSSTNDMNLSQQLLTYIDSHYTEVLSLESVAKALGVSKYYLSHIFSDKLHTSYPAYLSSRRVELAKNLLRSTTLSVTEVAYEAGFSSTRTFFRCFEESCHTTPKSYRATHASPSSKPSEV